MILQGPRDFCILNAAHGFEGAWLAHYAARGIVSAIWTQDHVFSYIQLLLCRYHRCTLHSVELCTPRLGIVLHSSYIAFVLREPRRSSKTNGFSRGTDLACRWPLDQTGAGGLPGAPPATSTGCKQATRHQRNHRYRTCSALAKASAPNRQRRPHCYCADETQPTTSTTHNQLLLSVCETAEHSRREHKSTALPAAAAGRGLRIAMGAREAAWERTWSPRLRTTPSTITAGREEKEQGLRMPLRERNAGGSAGQFAAEVGT